MPAPLIDETNKRYGKLMVLRPIRRPEDRKTMWECQCDCGNTIICTGSELRTGKRTSCGKHCNGIKDETGKTYSHLTVLYQDPTPAKEFADNSTHWFCKCNLCGNIKSISGKSLRNGDTQTCGCTKSLGEQLIAEILQDLHQPFTREYSFQDLISPLSTLKLRFDFAILNNNNTPIALIEYQGEQHERQVAYFGNKLEDIQRCDQAKRQYCAKYNIPLLIVSHINGKLPNKEDLSEQIDSFIKGEY